MNSDYYSTQAMLGAEAVPMYAEMSGSRFRYRRGFGWAGLLVMAAGMLVLAKLRLLPEGYLSVLWPLWPALLAAIGARWLGARFHPWLGSVAALAVVAAALGAAWWLASGTGGDPFSSASHPIRVVAGEARTLRLDLDVGAGELRIRPGTAGGLLVEGTLEADGSETAVRPQVRDRDGAWRVRLANDGPQGPLAWFGQRPGETWDLQLRPDIPTDIRIDGGATRLDLDLARLAVWRLDVESGLADTHVVLPAAAI